MAAATEIEFTFVLYLSFKYATISLMNRGVLKKSVSSVILVIVYVIRFLLCL